MIWLFDTLGEAPAIALLGLAVGLLFGAAAQRSAFCLRAATIEVATLRPGPKLATWLIVFITALTLVQGGLALGWLDLSEARQFAQPGSISGALIGGAMFGTGMILARGCASRLLVLSATGNLRALISGLVLTLVAQASLTGILGPARLWLFSLWQVPPGPARDLGALAGLTPAATATLSLAALAAALIWARAAARKSPGQILASALVGVAVAAGWFVTYHASQIAFEPVSVSSISFTGPATDTLMGLVGTPSLPLSFGLGLVPGVFLGSFAAALAAREFSIQRFQSDTPMERYLIGGAFMGFGAMLAGGCAVGAGVSGGSALSSTAWLALTAMWLSAMATHRLLNNAPSPATA
ncbi:YeeE/YedE family protein [Vannielia litorea]|uniref:YeeE/YedE family protein n=1 Tax=Vannielia litorea TaxID=1217970 RepID=UPI001C973318|nr:YeeE/YedE family protein [Vannielia litorea]MBY6154166.1 YeeE/YedE family protein [Vannielia litorea]